MNPALRQWIDELLDHVNAAHGLSAVQRDDRNHVATDAGA
jgi:predicted small metal-binding protein